MRHVTGIGGIYFKATDPKALCAWYGKHFGILPRNRDDESYKGTTFEWRERDKPDRVGSTVWSIMSADTKYTAPSRSSFMINCRVEILQTVLDSLREEGVWVDEKTEESEFGKFGRIADPEGNKIEVWEPAAGM